MWCSVVRGWLIAVMAEPILPPMTKAGDASFLLETAQVPKADMARHGPTATCTNQADEGSMKVTVLDEYVMSCP